MLPVERNIYKSFLLYRKILPGQLELLRKISRGQLAYGRQKPKCVCVRMCLQSHGTLRGLVNPWGEALFTQMSISFFFLQI